VQALDASMCAFAFPNVSLTLVCLSLVGCVFVWQSDYNDPLEMIKHLFVGSEGTFGFVSRATYHSVRPSRVCQLF
jgi:hypothetical protein